MKTLAIIIARGGSKRIPRKNIKSFCGKPIIAYSIEAARKSGCFDTIMCSIDDAEIAEVARKYGAEVPFFRSEATANDYATTADVLTEVIAEYNKRGENYDYFCCIYPTAPFISAEKLSSGLKLMLQTGAGAALPVVRYSYPIQRALKIDDGKLSMLEPANVSARSQDLQPAYHDIGQYYWFQIDAFKRNPNMMLLNPVAIITPEIEVQDIDTEEDWQIAEMKYRMLHNLLP